MNGEIVYRNMKHGNYYLVCYHPTNIDQLSKPNRGNGGSTMETIEKRDCKMHSRDPWLSYINFVKHQTPSN